jgi:hypothetical protein
MSAQPTNPHFLVLEKYALSKAKAREAVVAVLQQCDVQRPKEGWESLRLTWKDGSSPASVGFSELVDEARLTGIVQRLQEYLDRKDPVFGGTFGDFCTPNFQLRCKSAYAGWEKEAQGPCRTSCVERDLTDDILEYRRQACERSNEYDFRITARSFREYLSACVSLLDAFINRHILLARHDGFTSPEFSRLQTETNMEEKVRLWWAVCSDDDSSPFFRSAMWCHFQELRTRRNEILHAVDPISVYALKDIQVYLNKVQTGVGELLLLLRKAHKKPTLGFIERLRTAPKVNFHRICFRADGEHQIKVLNG